MLELVIRAVQRIAQAIDVVTLGGQRRAQLLELAGGGRVPVVALRERLAKLAKLLLPIGQLAIALEHLDAMFLDETSRFRGSLLPLLDLAAQLGEVAFVGRKEVPLSVDLVLALVQRDLQSRPRGAHVVSILLEPAAQRFDVARQRRHLFALPRGGSVPLLVALAQLVAQVLELGGQLDEAMLALGERGTGAFARCGSLACRLLARGGGLQRRAFARGGVVLRAREVRLSRSPHVVGFGQCALESCNLAAQRLDLGLRLERRCGLSAKLVQLEAQLGEPVVALLELAAQLVVGIALRRRLRRRRCRPRPSAPR